jgi:hypothetical protein
MTSTPEFSTMHAGAGRLVSLTDSGLDRLDQQTRKGETGTTPRTFLRNDDRAPGFLLPTGIVEVHA